MTVDCWLCTCSVACLMMFALGTVPWASRGLPLGQISKPQLVEVLWLWFFFFLDSDKGCLCRTWLSSSLRQFPYFCLPSAGIPGTHHPVTVLTGLELQGDVCDSHISACLLHYCTELHILPVGWICEWGLKNRVCFERWQDPDAVWGGERPVCNSVFFRLLEEPTWVRFLKHWVGTGTGHVLWRKRSIGSSRKHFPCGSSCLSC